MRIKVSIIGVLQNHLPNEEDVIEAESITVDGVVDALIEKYGASAAEELKSADGLRDGLSMLVNGRNVLSLPDMFRTSLQDGDEVVITVQVAGG